MIFKYPRLAFFPFKYFKNIFKKEKSHLLKYWTSNNKKFWILSRSTWSIIFIILCELKKKKRKINIWIPSYYCGNVISIIERLNINIYFYDIDKIEMLYNTKYPDIFLWVNYFYLNKIPEKFLALLAKNNTCIIEDSTQTLIPTAIKCIYSNYTLFSPYKFVSCTCGAILISNKNDNELDNINIRLLIKESENLFSDLIESKLESFIVFLKWLIKQFLFKGNASFLNEMSFQDYSYKSLKIEHPLLLFWNKFFFNLNLYNLNEIIILRENNLKSFSSLLKKLFSLKGLKNKFNLALSKKLELPPFLPITLPIMFQESSDVSEIFSTILKSGIEVNSLPDLHEDILKDKEKFKDALFFRQTLVHFPIHQSINYKEKDIDNLYELLKNKLTKI